VFYPKQTNRRKICLTRKMDSRSLKGLLPHLVTHINIQIIWTLTILHLSSRWQMTFWVTISLTTPMSLTEEVTARAATASIKTLNLRTSSLSSKKKTTTEALRSVILRPEKKRERSAPQYQRQGEPLKSTHVPFGDLRHCLINGEAASRHRFGGCPKSQRETRKEWSAERSAQRRCRSRSKAPTFQRSWTKSKSTLTRLNLLSAPSRILIKLASSSSRVRSDSERGSSRKSWTGLRRPWLHRSSQKSFSRGLNIGLLLGRRQSADGH
jgi:hypothetical protein